MTVRDSAAALPGDHGTGTAAPAERDGADPLRRGESDHLVAGVAQRSAVVVPPAADPASD